MNTTQARILYNIAEQINKEADLIVEKINDIFSFESNGLCTKETFNNKEYRKMTNELNKLINEASKIKSAIPNEFLSKFSREKRAKQW